MGRKRVSKKDRKTITEQAHGCCEYCQSLEEFATQDFAIEHVKPISEGGKHDMENLALACHGCNWHKYNKTEGFDSVTSKYFPLFNPRKQNWLEHFAWSNDFLKIIGLTPVGRATIDTLYLNRQKLQNRRRLCYSVKLHPPKHTLIAK